MGTGRLVATGADLPAGRPGELLFRGPNAFDGYFRDPELTAQVFDDEGWFHTGDIVVADEDGRLTFLSRLKDMLKVAGLGLVFLLSRQRPPYAAFHVSRRPRRARIDWRT
jgi:acyl-CoA synthetase (AMP-forming)/AMP-acid ligase II